MTNDELAPPAVSPDVYDEHYYLNACLGYEEWRASGGATPHPIYAGVLERAGLAAGETLVDLGTGRGELLAVAVEGGAERAIGVEYSAAAVELAGKTLAAHGVEDRTEVLLADARSVPLDDEIADVVTLVDVVEHLAPDELAAALRQAHRLLKPGGRLLVHTMPNRTIYSVTYRLQRVLRPSRLRSWPADPRNDWEHAMHVNEQTVTSLSRALRDAGFVDRDVSLGEWIYTDFVPDENARGLYARLAAHRLTERLGAGDLWAEGRRPGGSGAARR